MIEIFDTLENLIKKFDNDTEKFKQELLKLQELLIEEDSIN